MEELKLILKRLEKEKETNPNSSDWSWLGGFSNAMLIIKERIIELENSNIKPKITAQSEIKKLNDEAMVRDWEEQADKEIDEWINNPFKKRGE